jgi:PEP-CTERM motif
VSSTSIATFQSKDAKTGATSIPVLFNLIGIPNSQLPADLQGSQAAHMTFSITTTQHVAAAGNFLQQNLFSQLANGSPNYGTITFTRDTPDGEIHQTNLLTVSFSSVSGGLVGIKNGQTATLSADNTTGGNGELDFVQFSSAYLNFSSGADENLAFSFTSANPCFSMAKNVTKNSRGGCTTSGSEVLNFLHSFTAAGTGSFASDPAPESIFAVPEPATFSLLFLGAPLIGLVRRARNVRHRDSSYSASSFR